MKFTYSLLLLCVIGLILSQNLVKAQDDATSDAEGTAGDAEEEAGSVDSGAEDEAGGVSSSAGK
ncbi:unnamed protein product [Acanthoscelides obtectus]|uniref:Uncharacterized protein n=1 Tax=Acanthoscelides obtectus TaxID=200917 RepID=A0A9P0JT20_ACAOB|nr:unnamed protein product [Acanthoscelides obtectus]CAK1647961.1 hypothetical protein AOBTE_LOCUS15476 [Acanthoscelides obtectus]